MQGVIALIDLSHLRADHGWCEVLSDEVKDKKGPILEIRVGEISVYAKWVHSVVQANGGRAKLRGSQRTSTTVKWLT